MTTRSADQDTSTATLMANQSALVFAGLLFGGYGLGGDEIEGAQVTPVGAAGGKDTAAERHRTAKSAAADELLTAA